MSQNHRAEVAHLLNYLEHSNCQFYRNGAWHSAATARTHLERKYDYLQKKDLLKSTEDFITKAATASSVTGEGYKVKCKDREAAPSGRWLAEELERLRRSRNSVK